MALFSRLRLAPKNKCVAFVSDPLEDDVLAQSVVKRAQAGAVFRDDFKKLPGGHAGVVWEVQKNFNPPACLKAYKSKVWLLGHLNMKAGLVYNIR